MERLSEEHNHKPDHAAPTSLVPLQLANYHILKRADSLPTNDCPATKVNTRLPPSIRSWIFLFYFCFPFLSLTCSLFSPRNCPKTAPDALKSKVQGIKASRSLTPCACWNFRPSGMMWCDVMWLALLILFNYLLYYLFIFYLYFIYILFIFYLYFIYILFIFYLYYIYIIFILYLYYIYIVFIYLSHPLCAYTTSRLGSKVPHALMDHIESCLRNHDLPAPDAGHFTETEGGYSEVSCDPLFTVDFLTGTSHLILFFPQLISLSEVTSGIMDVPTLQLKRAAHRSPSLLNMIRVKEQRDLFGILNYANSSSLYICFVPSCIVFFHKKNRLLVK